MTVFPDWLQSRAASVPDREALVVEATALTFAQLDGEVTRTARQLASLGVTAGGRVATLLGNGRAAAILPHAALRLGATLVPLNTRLSDAELAWHLGDFAPRLLVVDGDAFERGLLKKSIVTSCRTVSTDERGAAITGTPPLHHIDEAESSLQFAHDSETVLAIIYTSGTTGRPKGAMLTVSNFWWSAIGSSLNLGVNTDDRWLACLPLFHVGGLSIIMRSAIYGTSVVVHNSFDASAVNASIDSDGVTLLSAVPVMLKRMLDARGDKPYPSSLRAVLLGGSPVSRELLERCASIGMPVVQTYGLTETCSQVATLSPEDALRKSGSAGKPLYPNELQIARTDGEDSGEIMVRGPVVMAGYAGDPAATAGSIVDGWLHTGDIGRLDDEGYLYVLDRRDDLIITGGENVYPAEVEAALNAHESVEESAVIGVADEEWGQRVVAVVRSKSSGNALALQAHCSTCLASYKVPREIRFVIEPLPRTASGKLRRTALRGTAPSA